MRIFASDRVAMMMKKLGMQPGEAIEHRWITRAIENAQRKVEGRNFDNRNNCWNLMMSPMNNVKWLRTTQWIVSQWRRFPDHWKFMDDVLNTCINEFIPPKA